MSKFVGLVVFVEIWLGGIVGVGKEDLKLKFVVLLMRFSI